MLKVIWKSKCAKEPRAFWVRTNINRRLSISVWCWSVGQSGTQQGSHLWLSTWAVIRQKRQAGNIKYTHRSPPDSVWKYYKISLIFSVCIMYWNVGLNKLFILVSPSFLFEAPREKFKNYTCGSHVSTGLCWSRNNPDVLFSVYIPDDLSQRRFFCFLFRSARTKNVHSGGDATCSSWLCLHFLNFNFSCKQNDHILPWCFSHSQLWDCFVGW